MDKSKHILRVWSPESLSRADSVTLQTVACQAPLFMRYSRQEYWSGFPFPPLGDLPNPGIKPTSPASAGGFFTAEPPGKPKVVFSDPVITFALGRRKMA